MTVRELREKFLAFFESKGHRRFPSGSLIPYDVTGRLDESLLFNGAGMIQFKPYFRGQAQPEHKRLITCQKCVRTGDIDEVGDLTHLTFFEMLGNFSFGDYFKDVAIAYSWEFLTDSKWLGLDPKKLSFTIFEEDDEAYAEWSKWFAIVGIDPGTRIFRLGEETNYWPAGAFSKGPPGPCGPNSEMFYWVSEEEAPSSGAGDRVLGAGSGPATGPQHQPYSRDDWQRDEAEGKWLEIWNDVFIQFEWAGQLKNPERPSDGYVKLGMPALPFKSVDTGMGLDRTAAVLMGGGSVYHTDSFEPIFRQLETISGGRLQYGRANVVIEETIGGPAPHAIDHSVDRAMRIVADHIRTAVFCIADGVLPGNSGRGYVLRRLIRRAVLKGQRVLGFEEPFFHRVYEGVVEAMGDVYPEIVERRETIVETLRSEEELFRRTVSTGTEMLLQSLSEIYRETLRRSQMAGLASPEAAFAVKATMPGELAFRLYDTYGFPLEVTQELAAEAGVEVDLEGYERALKEAQERSRGGQEREQVYGHVAMELVIEVEEDSPTQTVFVGYDRPRVQTEIVGALPAEGTGNRDPGTDSSQLPAPGSQLVIALKESPFYAESGGQVADTGTIAGGGFEAKVVDVIKQNGVWVHEVEVSRFPGAGSRQQAAGKAKNGPEIPDPRSLFRLQVEAEIDEPRRARIIRNHTATHLLHAALRQTLGKHVAQAGSYVGPDRLRFDFTHGKAMTEDELKEVERIVNEEVLKNTKVVVHLDIPIAEAKARGAMALFGEKYGDKVRMVEIGEFSKELCGGTHVRFTGEIGLFKIVHEASAASGVRRIEALTGEGAYEWVLELVLGLHEAAGKLKLPPKSGVKEVLSGIEKLHESQRDLKHRLARAAGSRQQASAPVESVKGVELAVEAMKDADSKDAAALADNLAANQPNRVVLVGSTSDGKVTFVCKVGAEAQKKGAHAGNLIREVAKIAGGGGGGRPDFATAGGKDAAKLDEALAAAPAILAGMLSG